MEKNYFTNKEIIMGLRDDFIYRNQILLEMEKIMKPLKKSIKVNATYDPDNKSVCLDATFNSIAKEIFYRLFYHKYVYEASLKNNDNGNFVLDENSDSDKKIFPIDFDIDMYIKLNKLFDKLIARDYPISNRSSDVYVMYNSIAIFERLNSLHSEYITYDPRGDLLSFGLADKFLPNDHITELLMHRHHKDDFSDEARKIIEENPNTYKPVRYLESDFNDSNELNYGIRVSEKDILLVKKLIK